MASSLIKDSLEKKLPTKAPQLANMKDEEENEEEGEEELFEINLEAVNSIPPPQYYWESYVTAATSNTLLANCLLPISDVSSAIPMVSTACSLFSAEKMTDLIMVAESVQNFPLRVSYTNYMGPFVFDQHKEMRAYITHN